MIEVTAAFMLVGVPAVLLAGISKGGFGSGASFVAAPMLALVMPPEQALGLLMPLLLAIDLVTLGPYWRRWDRGLARLLLIGAVPGVALGIAFWKVADADALRLLIGGIALGYVALTLLRAGRQRVSRPGAVTGIGAGCLAGFTSFVSHAGGPVAAVFLLSQDMSKTRYQATTVLVFGVVNVAKTIAYAGLGAITVQSVGMGLYLLPAALLGAYIGVVAHRVVPERAFFVVTYVLLTGAGARLIYDALA